MDFGFKGVLREIAFRALLLAICVSVTFSSAAQVVLPSLSSIHAPVANESSSTHPSSVPEEAPPETPGSNEPTKEGEAPSFSLRRKSHKSARFYVRQSDLACFSSSCLLTARALLVGSKTPSRQFEHSYRNGCGAHLRC